MRQLKNKKIIALFVIPGMLVYVIFFLWPILSTFYYSTFEWNGYSDMIFTGFDNYLRLFKDRSFETGIKNIGILLVAVLGVQLPISLLLALLLSRITKGARVIKTLFFVPIVFSATAIGLVWLRMFDAKYGFVNQLFTLLGMDYQQNWLSEPQNVMWAVCIPVVWCKIGYYLVILYAGIKSIPNDYYQAALLDGCNGIQATMKITIPLLRNVISMCAVLCAIGAIKEYPLIYVMTLGGPFKSSMTPAIHMYLEAFTNSNFGYSSAIAVVLVVISLITYKLMNVLFPTKDIQY